MVVGINSAFVFFTLWSRCLDTNVSRNSLVYPELLLGV